MKIARWFAVLICLVPLSCDERTVVGPATPITQNRQLMAVADSAGVVDIARGLAEALSDPRLRRLLLEDLRDAPTKRHSIHLASYLAGNRGRQLALSIANAQQISNSRILTTAGAGIGLELLMTRPMDRLFWRGENEFVVVAQTRPSAAYAGSDHVEAFGLNGIPVSIEAFSAPTPRVLVVRPVETLFGATPEADRSSAPHHDRETISTRAEEYELLRAQSAPHLDEDPGGGGGLPVGHVLPSYFTTETCRGPGQDSDGDSLLDQCEYEFATTFAPQLSITNGESCGSREPNWSVGPTAGVYRSVTIFYALGYYLDCGSYGHVGDSEFIILRVDEYSSSGSWRLYNVTMSAHWHHWLGDRTATYAASDIQYGNDYQFGRPLVWVSQGKHANYRSQSICNAQWWFPVDNCGDSHIEVVDAATGVNVGQSYGQTVSSVYSRAGQSGVEKYWDTYFPFCGWQQRNYECATAYNDMLYFYGF